ncbi:MAG: sulfite exporter TauE/SafE family protein [Bdellovibrionales bacterium]
MIEEWMEVIIKLSPLAMSMAVFTASLVGSLHCLGMCGPLQVVVAPTPTESFVYHSGRFFSYTLLGFFAGYFGEVLFSVTSSTSLAWLSAISFSVMLFVIAVKTFASKSKFHFTFQTKLSNWIFVHVLSLVQRPVRSLILGVLTPLLPCGWLLSFLLGAALTQKAIHGGLFMASFWLGTLPVLGLLPMIRKHLFKLFGMKTHQFASVLLLLTALSLICVRMLVSYQHTSCH